jgi:hypothetical protein
VEVLVEPWDADGRALILGHEEGRLVAAKDQPGFLRVERYEEPRLRGVLPGGNWKVRKRNDVSSIGHDVVAFLVYEAVFNLRAVPIPVIPQRVSDSG